MTTARLDETEVLALLEQIVATTGEAQAYVQADAVLGLSPSDCREIGDRLRHIRALTLEIDHLLAGWDHH